MKNWLFKFWVIYFLFAASGFAQEAFFSSNSTGMAFSGFLASGDDYKSKGFGALFLHKGKLFLGYEHDAVQIWLKEDGGYYSYKIEQSWDAFYLGFRNFENPEKKQYSSFTFQTGYAFSTLDYATTIRMIPIVVTLFKQFSNNRVKVIPLIYGTYAYIFTRFSSGLVSTKVSTENSYGVQLNAVIRPLAHWNHGLAAGLDFNLKDRDAPLSFQFSLVFNAFKEDKSD